jgi:hypothetical protein
MNALDYLANAIVDVKDLVAYALFPLPVPFFSHSRKYEIYSPASKVPRSYVKLKASTKQGLKPIAAESKRIISSGAIPSRPFCNTSLRGFLRYYISSADIKLSAGRNIRPNDQASLVNFLDSVEREFP